MEKLKKKSYQCKHDIITDPIVYHQILILCKIPSACLIHPHLGIVAYQLLKKRKSELLLYSLAKYVKNKNFQWFAKTKLQKKLCQQCKKKVDCKISQKVGWTIFKVLMQKYL